MMMWWRVSSHPLTAMEMAASTKVSVQTFHFPSFREQLRSCMPQWQPNTDLATGLQLQICFYT